MARPPKSGLDYFPLDVGFYRDIKIRKLIRCNGGKALAVYTVLLCNIYENGYYMVWDEDVPFMLSEITGFEEGMVHEAIKYCLSVGLFDKEMFTTHHVLTSADIQSRYLAAIRRRTTTTVELPFLLVSGQEKEFLQTETGLMQPEQGLLHTETQLSDAESTQIKLNKRKETSSSTAPAHEEKTEKKKILQTETGLMQPEQGLLHTETQLSDAESGKLPSGNGYLLSETETGSPDGVSAEVIIHDLKEDREWMLQMQQLYGLEVLDLENRMDTFVTECAVRGKKTHEDGKDVQRHFNDWLKLQLHKEGSSPNVSSPSSPSSDYARRWIQCKAELCRSVSSQESAVTYKLLEFESFTNKVLFLSVPSRDVIDRLEGGHLDTMRRCIRKYFGSCKLNYHMPSN